MLRLPRFATKHHRMKLKDMTRIPQVQIPRQAKFKARKVLITTCQSFRRRVVFFSFVGLPLQRWFLSVSWYIT